MQRVKKKIDFAFVYLFTLLFLMIVVLDSNVAGEGTYNNIIVPHIVFNFTILLIIISFIPIIYIFINRKKKFNLIFILLLIRIPLYFLPLIYLDGEFAFGVSYAVIQCMISFFICEYYDGSLDKLIKLLVSVTVIVSLEVFYTIIANHINFFHPALKWYMTLPLGRCNYIACILVPFFAISFTYYFYKKKYLFLFLYTLFTIFAVLGTGSKWGLLLLGSFIVLFLLIKGLKLIKIKKHSRIKIVFLTFITISLIMVVAFNGQYIIELFNKIINKFTSGNIFYDRIQVYKEFWHKFLEHPIFGLSAFKYHLHDTDRTHNFLFESLIQTGVVGTIIYLCAIIMVFVNIFKINDKLTKDCFLIFVVIYLIQGLVEPNLFGASSDAVFWGICGISCSFKDKTMKNKKQILLKNK